jgi:hypothetical protein
MGFKNYEDIIIKSGVISSVCGVAILVLFITVLLVYPISKVCEDEVKDCNFVSHAPQPIKRIVQPTTLVISLGGIAAGIFLLRIGIWNRSRKIA